jgi:1,5-anhydro-D-fructose reductase (1,5-anhydro-D-mannitol-forming)
VLDLVDYLAGPLLDVAGWSAAAAPDGLPGASVAMSFRTGSGALGTASWCFVTDVREDCLDLVGTQGRMRLRMYWDHVVELDGESGSQRIPAPDPEHVYEPFVRHVVATLAGSGDGKPIGTADAGVRAAEVMSSVLTAVAPPIPAAYRPLSSGPVLAGGR